MKLRDLLALCDALSPFELQEAWDNSGLIIGDPDQQISSVVVSLECDKSVIDRAPQNACIITHHPLIFALLKRLDFSTYPAILIRELISKNISLIALHTNFDKTHLGAFVAKEVLGWSEFDQDGYLCHRHTKTTLDQLLSELKSKNITIRSVVDGGKDIERVTLCTGSGGSLVGKITTDCLITGDLKYHEAVEAQALGRSVIDIGHYESERYFGEIMSELLKANGTNAIIADSKNPFVSL